MKQIVGLLLILLALYLAYNGYMIFQDSAAELKFLGLELDISDQSGKQASYMHFAGALISFLAGIFLLKN